MHYRRPRTAQGQYVNFLLTTDNGFDIPAETHAAEIGAALGQPVTIVEGDVDPWDGVSALVTITPPPPPPPAPDPDAELTAAIEAATDFASLKAALLGNRGAGKVKGRPV